MDTLSAVRLKRPSGRIAEVRQLTGLRGVAALNVMLSHAGGINHPWLRPFLFFEPAVDIFFCLSCFTLCLVYHAESGEPIDWRRFAIARFARLYPVYAIITLLTFAYMLHWDVAGFLAVGMPTLIDNAIRQALLIAAWPLPGPGGFYVGPAWSVSVEAFCYAVMFPLLRPLTPALRRIPAGAALVLMLLPGAINALLHQLYFSPLVNIAGAAAPPDRFAYALPVLRGSLMFVAGWLAYELWARRDLLAAAAALATDALALSMVALVAGERIGLTSPELLVPLAPLLILGLMDGRSVTARLLASWPLHALGLISYSLYLVHVPLLAFTLLWRGGSPVPFAYAVPMIIGTASLSYVFIERPARRWIRSAFEMRAAVETTPG